MRPEEYKVGKEKFVLVNENKKLHDKELVTKPIGFFKDAMYRFTKNKGSIVGAIVIGILVLYALIIPIFSQYTVSYHDNYYSYILPKVINSEHIDFLDGASNETTNLTTFIEHYSKGLETGHNAIKRQSYKYDATKDMYSYRLDSYQKVGCVFMRSVSRSDYYAMQEYQDKTGIQIIYPITQPDKRPQAKKNETNANFWYETKPDGSSNDVPVNYSFNSDGTVTLSNIYQKFTVPIMNSTSSASEASFVTLEAKGAGYALKLGVAKGNSYNGDVLKEDVSLGYLTAKYEREVNSTELVENFEDASTFIYDSVYDTLKVNITGHENASEDGVYYFGLPSGTGSTADLLAEAKLGNADNIPFSLYDGEQKVTSIELNKRYNFAANRTKDGVKEYFVGTFDYFSNSFNTAASYGASSKYTLIASGTGYKLAIVGSVRTDYINPVVSGNDNKFASTTEADQAVAWTFDTAKGALKVNLTGHTTPANDGEYYLAYDIDSGVQLLKAADIDASNTKLYLSLINNNALEPVNSITDGGQYTLYKKYEYIINGFYYVDGTFKGDNYFSKMRIEGKDNFEYDYAIQKNSGKQYEIRVNYYEYYKYYHTQVAKDRITEPYFIFGTTASGQDIFTCLASGARFSFIMAIIVASVNLIVGAIYGALEGYYGGKVDIIMERIVEILSAVPFMIVITLLKYHMNGSSQVLILFIAFFLTGWIGMSGLVRMQFYRFKNQEYVLAARTLGASDPRIMFKHIFPNALGTIVTSTVLVIPGMIFSETSLSYLGIINLDSGTMTSVGTLLAHGQPYLVSYPHMIMFPAIFISLLMLCFNLFGNGLRDAFNPSLRGTED